MLRLFLVTIFLLLLALSAGAFFQQPDQPLASAPSQTDLPAKDPATDDATLNLHRWGAVTLFHGLPSDRVRAIAADARGAVWFGTDNGLVRYDGRNVQPLVNENALPARRILALALDGRGVLWVGTEAGAARIRGEQVEVLAETRGRAVNGIAVSERHEIVLATDAGEIIRYSEGKADEPHSTTAAPKNLSFSKLDQAGQRLLSLNDQNETARPLVLTAATITASGVFWLGSSGRGPLIYSSDELREAALQPPRPYHIAAIYAAGNKVWVGEQSGKAPGLWLFDGSAIAHLPINTGAVTALHGDGANDLWVGTQGQGVFLLRNSQVIEHLTFENTGGGLRSNRINAVYRDREGIVWFGTDRGVCRYDRDSFRAAMLSNLPSGNYVRTLLHSRNGEVWAGTNRGLYRLAAGADLGPWLETPEMQGRAVYALAEDGAGAVWAGTSNGLFSKANATASFERVVSEMPAEFLIESRESVRALAVFRGQVFAALYERGLAVFAERKATIFNDAALPHTLSLAVEGDTALWAGTAEGELLRYDGAQFQLIADLRQQLKDAPERSIRALAVSQGRVWLGTAQGLFVREGETVRVAIPNVDVQALLIANETAANREAIWCATRNAGLFKYLPQETISIRFDTEQGLTSQQVFALAARQGETVWIGSNRGLVRHQPNFAQPQLEVRRLVADRTYAPEFLAAELSLPSTQRNFLLEVTALGSRTFPSQFQYEFTIQRRNGDEARRVLTYEPQFAVENLRAGPYTISVRALSRDLIYSAPLVVKFRIRNAPFPWTTVLLGSLLAVAVGAAIWAFRQRQRLTQTNRTLADTNAELHDTRLRLANETETERARIARDLHDQTLADLRHLLVLTDQLPADGAAPSPAVLRREIESISNEIRHICEDLSPSVLENIGFLPALEWALSDAVAQLPAAEKFSYEFVCEPDLEDRLQLSAIEQIQLYRIVQEALNNICRHARARHVSLRVRVAGGRDLVLEICDDGLGFAGVAPVNATGHGVANIRSRANLINAQIAWQATEPGCRFTVRQPGCVK